LKRLLKYFKSEFPNDVVDIRDSIDLLYQCLNSTVKNINIKAATAFSEREFDKMSILSDCVKQIDEVQVKLESYSSLLDLEDDVEEFIVSNKSSEMEDKKMPNYADYAVDSDVAYALIEDFTHKRPAAFSLFGKRMEASGWKYVFVLTCEELVTINKDIFCGFLNDKSMQGRKVAYFAQDSTGMRKPEKIAGTDIYATTNMSANNIRNIISKMLGKYNINSSDYKIYLKADYTTLHG